MKKLFISIALIGVLLLAGCDQWTARNFGGDYTLDYQNIIQLRHIE